MEGDESCQVKAGGIGLLVTLAAGGVGDEGRPEWLYLGEGEAVGWQFTGNC